MVLARRNLALEFDEVRDGHLRVEAMRGELVESVHRVSVAVVDAEGRLVARAGDPDFVTFIRSAAKPFQALPLVEDGAAQRFGVTDEELALACASHNSEPAQVDAVRRFLTRLGLAESDLACGPHRPLSAELALADASGAPSAIPKPQSAEADQSGSEGRLASNCSGKHVAMLALALHRGWSTSGYHQAGHPVQRRCLQVMAHWTGLPDSDIGEAVDGCGVVTFAIPMRSLALAYARLAASDQAAPRRVVQAMMSHPHLVAGRWRPCTALMRAYPGRLLAKVGAEGVYGAALPERRLGIGVKVEDGHTWASVVALWAVLEQLGLDPPPRVTEPGFAEVPIRNTRGEVVGSLRASGKLTFV
ncbi:MAG: asparaginase [Gemmatimonadetes bacterium]|nr:asparaginase [Gemmatimonadota bacterium]